MWHGFIKFIIYWSSGVRLGDRILDLKTEVPCHNCGTLKNPKECSMVISTKGRQNFYWQWFSIWASIVSKGMQYNNRPTTQSLHAHNYCTVGDLIRIGLQYLPCHTNIIAQYNSIRAQGIHVYIYRHDTEKIVWREFPF